MLRKETQALIDELNASDSTPEPDDNNDWHPPTGPKRSYPQDWKAYDAAKTNEDVLFKRLLAELLLLAVNEPEPHRGPGRKPYSTRNKLFCMCIKTYYKSDLRKAESMLKELKNLGLVASVPCYRTIDGAFNDAALNKILDHLILITSLPLAHIEQTGAMDSTGFSVSKYDSWFDHKWGGEEGRTRCWRKLHAVTGTRTNVFITVDVTEKNVADIKMLPTLVADAPKYFQMQDFVADKAYSSRAVFTFLDKIGLNPFIPFKINSTTDAKGSPVWRDMYQFFINQNPEFMKTYHQRSNVESCFHMLKQRYGHQLWTKNFVANTNEIKTRVLCHNLCVLIQEASEQGINADFESCEKMINPVKK